MIISGDRRISYPEIFARAARAATGLKELGLAGGTPVAMMLRNDFAFFEVSVRCLHRSARRWCRSTGTSRPTR